jgi:hypothetical protein
MAVAEATLTSRISIHTRTAFIARVPDPRIMPAHPGHLIVEVEMRLGEVADRITTPADRSREAMEVAITEIMADMADMVVMVVTVILLHQLIDLGITMQLGVVAHSIPHHGLGDGADFNSTLSMLALN